MSEQVHLGDKFLAGARESVSKLYVHNPRLARVMLGRRIIPLAWQRTHTAPADVAAWVHFYHERGANMNGGKPDTVGIVRVIRGATDRLQQIQPDAVPAVARKYHSVVMAAAIPEEVTFGTMGGDNVVGFSVHDHPLSASIGVYDPVARVFTAEPRSLASEGSYPIEEVSRWINVRPPIF